MSTPWIILILPYFDTVYSILRLDRSLFIDNKREDWIYITGIKLENLAIPDLRVAIGHAEESGDYGTRQILREILDSEEEHVDWIEKQLGLIEKVGEQNYIQSQT